MGFPLPAAKPFIRSTSVSRLQFRRCGGQALRAQRFLAVETKVSKSSWSCSGSASCRVRDCRSRSRLHAKSEQGRRIDLSVATGIILPRPARRAAIADRALLNAVVSSRSRLFSTMRSAQAIWSSKTSSMGASWSSEGSKLRCRPSASRSPQPAPRRARRRQRPRSPHRR